MAKLTVITDWPAVDAATTFAAPDSLHEVIKDAGVISRPDEFLGRNLVKSAIRANWEAYHYCLGRSPNAEYSIGRYLTWLITNVPDYFLNLVVCTHLPSEGLDDLIESALAHFRSLNIRKLSWVGRAGVPQAEMKRALLAHGLTFRETYATEMAVDLSSLPEDLPAVPGLRIAPVVDGFSLKQWIHIASIGFRIGEEFEGVWSELFADAIYDRRFRTYLALLDGKPVGTSQLFISEGVAGIYNVTCIPEARGRGIGSAVTLAPLLEARKLGYRIGILQASKQGYSVYRRLGFQDFGYLSVFHWDNDQIKSKETIAMSANASTSLNSRNSLLRSIVTGGIIIGSLHLIIQDWVVFSLLYKNPFISVLQYLASGALGNAAFEGGIATALLGVLFHYLVSCVVAGVFVLSAGRIPLVRRYVIVGSLLYGIGVFIVMNFIVLPLSAAPSLPASTPLQLIEGIIEHVLVIGLPLGLLIRRDANFKK